MSDIDANAVVDQAIADLDAIESAIEEKGINVSQNTPTSEYDEKIRLISGGGFCPIQYVESVDTDNPLYLRDLESGTYVLYGRFRPYNGSTNSCTFSTGMLVSVIRNTSISYIQIFYSKNNTIQYCEITDDTYKRTDAKLINMESTANLTTSIDENSDDTHYPSAKAVFDVVDTLNKELQSYIEENEKTANNGFSNALKSTASGEVIRVDDVSPIEHTAKAKVSGKNLFNIDEGLNEYLVKNADGTYTITRRTNRFSEYVSMPVPANTTVTVSCVGMLEEGFRALTFQFEFTDGTTAYANMTSEVKVYVRTFDKDVRRARIYLLPDAVEGDYKTFTGIQVEHGDTATEYEPYIDPTTVTVTRCGKNLLEIKAKSTTSAGITYTVNEDGSVTANGTATDTSTLILDPAFVFKPNVSYTLTGCPSGGGVSTYRLDDTNKNADDGNGGTVTYSAETTNPIRIRVASGATVSNLKFRPMLVCKGESGDFEKCVISTYTPSADGTCEIVSVAPTMTLLTDTSGANIDLEYNQDTNKAMENVNADLQELDKVTAELANQVGDFETALDNAIALCDTYINGGA